MLKRVQMMGTGYEILECLADLMHVPEKLTESVGSPTIHRKMLLHTSIEQLDCTPPFVIHKKFFKV